MNRIISFLLLFFVCTTSLALAESTEKMVYVIHFNDYQSGSEEDWLLGKGFQFKEDARYRNRVGLEVDDNSLIIEAKQRALGILINETVNISDFTFVEIDWGINKFPKGASYEQGVRNEAIMLMIFMGDERLPSGSIFIPNSPYFIGLFPCYGDDRVNHPYIGSYFKKGGRYVCVDKPAIRETITTRFNLLNAYRNYFDKERDDDPGISGIALLLNTKKAGDKGKSSAFIHEIRFYR